MSALYPIAGDAFELRITLRHIEPAIWRQVRVPAELSLGALHDVLQLVFGWTDSHLHEFVAGDLRFGMADPSGERLVVDEHGAPLGAIAREGSTFFYHYDFGDDWEHDVWVERVIEGGGPAISCTAGARACPPEDCGGPMGYERILAILANPKDEEYADTKKWVGRGFDPEKLDLVALNKRLSKLLRGLGRG